MTLPDASLTLSLLASGCPAITPSLGQVLAEAASVALAERGHLVTSEIIVTGNFACRFALERLPVTAQMQLAYNDAEEATELGACGVAILLVRELSGLTVVQRSAKGGGFDYWLGEPAETTPFDRKARLEVSGIRSGDNSILRTRVGEKMRQASTVSSPFPVYVVVVEFGSPKAQVEKQ